MLCVRGVYFLFLQNATWVSLKDLDLVLVQQASKLFLNKRQTYTANPLSILLMLGMQDRPLSVIISVL